MSSQKTSPTASSHRRAEPQYVIYAANLPESLTTSDWRPFKDFIRSSIRGQPGWVTGEPHRNAAWANLRNAPDARQAWDALTGEPVGGRVLEVKLFKIDSRECRLIRSTESGVSDTGAETAVRKLRNFSLDPLDQEAYTSAPFTTTAAVSPAISPTAAAASMTPVSDSYYPASAFYQTYESVPPLGYGGVQSGYGTTAPQLPVQGQYPVQLAYQAQPIHQTQPEYQPQHIYQQNQYQLPVNVGQGSVEVERRSVFIRKLPKDVTEKDIRKLLQKRNLTGFGDISLIVDARTNKGKGHATVKFVSAEKVEEAIEELNGLKYKDSRLIVREAREATPVVPHPYMVVNGST